jgi:hypothetical protein
LTTLSVASPACNHYRSPGDTVQFSDFPNYAFVGDFTLIVKFTNNIFFGLGVLSGASISPSSVIDFNTKSTSTNSAYPNEPYDGTRPGFAKVSSAGTFELPTSRPRVGTWVESMVLGTFYMRIRRQGTSLQAHVSGDNVTYYSSSSGTSFYTTCGGIDPVAPFGSDLTIPAGDKVMIVFSPYDIMGFPQATSRSMQLSCPFTFPSSATFSPSTAVRNVAKTVTLTTTGHDTSIGSTCSVYSLQSGTYTLVGTGTLSRSGTAPVQCTFTAAGTFNVAYIITSGAGLASGYKTCPGTIVVT